MKKRVITFGSCLSRYTANHFVRLFGGEIISSVYHNRSDAFVGKFLEKDWKIYEYDSLKVLLKDEEVLPEGVKKPTITSADILNNQYAETIGKHSLKKGLPLFKVLNKKLADIIMIDNYMDLSGRLLTLNKGAKEGIFLRLGDVAEDCGNFVLDEYLEPKDAVVAMNKIIDYFKSQLPNATIAFMNFPHNTYEDENRTKRTKEYESLLKRDDVLMIPCWDIHKNFHTHQKQHFKPQQYAAYAGYIYHYFLSKTN